MMNVQASQGVNLYIAIQMPERLSAVGRTSKRKI